LKNNSQGSKEKLFKRGGKLNNCVITNIFRDMNTTN